MELRRWTGFACGIVLGLTVAACATQFPYPYYGLDLKDQMLSGPDASKDLPLADCDATASDASPCSVMFTQAMLELKKDYIDTKNALNACQHQIAIK